MSTIAHSTATVRMSLAITDDHRELARVVRDIAAKYQLPAQTRSALETPAAGLDSAWSAMAELGWCGLHLPAHLGGSGFGLAELAVVLDELGAAVAPGPFLAASIGSAVVSAAGSGDLQRALLPSAATGASVITYGIPDELHVADGTASGRVERVLGGVWADYLVLASGADLCRGRSQRRLDGRAHHAQQRAHFNRRQHSHRCGYGAAASHRQVRPHRHRAAPRARQAPRRRAGHACD